MRGERTIPVTQVEKFMQCDASACEHEFLLLDGIDFCPEGWVNFQMPFDDNADSLMFCSRGCFRSWLRERLSEEKPGQQLR